MNITRFDPLKVRPAHEGTILADDVVPAGMHELTAESEELLITAFWWDAE